MGSIANGNGLAPTSNGMPSLTANRGQMDINMLYQKLLELSDILRDNREQQQCIVATAEAYASQAGNSSIEEAARRDDVQYTAAHMAELTRENLDLQMAKGHLLRESAENVALLKHYEHAVGGIIEQVRAATFDKEGEKLKISREYNQLLQDEKDAHLRTRLERDEWHSRFLQSLDMLRKAHRLRSEEEEHPVRVIAGLQNEVRCYRHALGLDPEQPEDEYGHQYLKLG